MLIASLGLNFKLLFKKRRISIDPALTATNESEGMSQSLKTGADHSVINRIFLILADIADDILSQGSLSHTEVRFQEIYEIFVHVGE